MYPKNETDQSFAYLKNVVSSLEEPICLIGGWAVYLTVNRQYKAAMKKNYLGSRDIDLGFHLQEDTIPEKSAFSKAMKKLEEEGFANISGRMVKELDWDTGKELSKEEANKKAPFEINMMYVDLMVDFVPSAMKKQGFVFDEPLLNHVFQSKENRTETKEFGKKLWLPKPWLLLATKTKSFPNRQKDHKREKDACDIAALIMFSKHLC